MKKFYKYIQDNLSRIFVIMIYSLIVINIINGICMCIVHDQSFSTFLSNTIKLIITELVNIFVSLMFFLSVALAKFFIDRK